MSLVGTRPILQDELRQYELHHRARIAIKPGITGMWQVSGRSDITDFEEVVRLDTEWGNIEKALIGYSSNKKIRFKAASGGALTEICCYLLIRPRSTMSWAGCRRPSLRTALKRPSSGISIIVSGGRPSSAVNIRTIMRKCTATANRRKEHEVFCNRRWRSAGT